MRLRKISRGSRAWLLTPSVTLMVAACSKLIVGSSTPVSPLANVAGEMRNVQGVVRGDSVAISFDLVDGAKDYRVYVLPANADVLLLPGGDVAVRNGTYRCAGDREVPPVETDDEPPVQSSYVHTYVNHSVLGYGRTTDDATLGYVYTSAGPGRVAVYALGDPSADADNTCYFDRWNASRVKKYVIQEDERANLLAAGWRDDGIAFYAPAPGTASTRQVSTALSGSNRLYFNDGPEASARAGLGPSPAFLVLSSAAEGTQPLMRAYYQNGCGNSHDELVAGQAMFQRIVHQGNQPLNQLLWSGLTGPTTLVVEALDQGCPFQGHLSPVSFPADSHQAFFTIEDIRATAANGEVFVNGQHEAGNRPKAIARSYLEVAPQTAEPLDFYDTFSGPLGGFTETQPAFQTVRRDYGNYDVTFYSIELPKFAVGQMLGELWVTYSDWASDTNGKFRLTPKRWASLAANSFLHVTMEVDIVTTGRRYPQILVSDRSWPIQEQLVNGETLIFQTFADPPQRLDIELCDHRVWEVNNQCPRFQMENGFTFHAPWRPQPEVNERMGVDRRARIDAYASTQRAYILLDGQPYGCVNLPAGKMPAGPVTVTYGDVLYHSGVDVPDPPFRFHRAHLYTETRRHFDEIGFKSGVAAPSWDEGKIPCTSTMVP